MQMLSNHARRLAIIIELPMRNGAKIRTKPIITELSSNALKIRIIWIKKEDIEFKK